MSFWMGFSLMLASVFKVEIFGHVLTSFGWFFDWFGAFWSNICID